MGGDCFVLYFGNEITYNNPFPHPSPVFPPAPPPLLSGRICGHFVEFRSVWGGGEDDCRNQRSLTVLQVHNSHRSVYSNLEHTYMRAHMFTRPHHRVAFIVLPFLTVFIHSSHHQSPINPPSIPHHQSPVTSPSRPRHVPLTFDDCANSNHGSCTPRCDYSHASCHSKACDCKGSGFAGSLCEINTGGGDEPVVDDGGGGVPASTVMLILLLIVIVVAGVASWVKRRPLKVGRGEGEKRSREWERQRDRER